MEVEREVFGLDDGDGEPRRAKRAASVSAALGAVGVVLFANGLDGLERFMELTGVVSKLTVDFLSAFRRARRASSWEVGVGIVGRTLWLGDAPVICRLSFVVGVAIRNGSLNNI